MPVVEVALVKAAGPGDHDRAWLTVAGVTRRGAVHVIQDVPHLAVESPFGIDGGTLRLCWPLARDFFAGPGITSGGSG